MWKLTSNTFLNWITAFTIFEIPLAFFYYFIASLAGYFPGEF